MEVVIGSVVYETDNMELRWESPDFEEGVDPEDFTKTFVYTKKDHPYILLVQLNFEIEYDMKWWAQQTELKQTSQIESIHAMDVGGYEDLRGRGVPPKIAAEIAEHELEYV